MKDKTPREIINEFIDELEQMKNQAHIRGNNLLAPDNHRAASTATAEAYGYVQIRLRILIDYIP